jgi:hypothetical protein
MTTHQSHLTLAYAGMIAFEVDFDVTAPKFSKEMVAVKDFTIDKTISEAALVAVHIISMALSWLLVECAQLFQLELLFHFNFLSMTISFLVFPLPQVAFLAPSLL